MRVPDHLQRADVLPLSAFGRGDVARAGGKGANLGELVRAGFPVPGGFVVTTDAYARAIEASGMAARIDGELAASDGAALRLQIERLAMQPELRARIAEAYLALGNGAVAVRSSATAEDLPGAAFAGQQDTYLGIEGEAAVADAVLRCWASLWTDRAIAYRRKLGIPSGEVRIAVVVQTLIDADIAGVMFTANPVTGDRSQTVIDASAGLGEAVVSGLVTPDHYVLTKDAGVVEWAAGRAEVVIRRANDGARAAAGAGTAADGAARERVTHEAGTASGSPLLDATFLERLVALGERVERHFGRPQDIEWAIAGGAVHLLQARPMTALPPGRLRLSAVQKRSATVVLDYLPVRPYPLDVTTWWKHGPVGMMAEVAATYGLSAFDNEMLPEVDGVVSRFVPPSPRPTIRAIGLPFFVGRRVRRFHPNEWMRDPRAERYDAAIAALRSLDCAAMPWKGLIRVPQRVFDTVDLVTRLRADYLPGAGIAMAKLLIELTFLRRRSLLGDLLTGARTRTTDGNEALAELAGALRDDPRLLAGLGGLSGSALVQRMNADPDFEAFRSRFAAFLVEFGHRETVSPVLASSPTWSELPEVPLGIVVEQARAGESAVRTGRTPAQDAEGRLFRLHALADPARRERMQRRIGDARAGIAFREDSHFEFMRALPPLRRVLLEMGRRLVRAGVLLEENEVFHLRLEELEAIVDPGRMPRAQADRLRAAVRSRSALRDELASVPLIDSSQFFPAPSGDALVQGTPACRGIVTGIVRVVKDAREFDTLQRGEILVCPYTNPSWTPLFQRAAAVVVDSGGTASHAAIVAREYGLPAIMGTGNATTTLVTGQRVTVDGDSGRVLAAEGPGRSA